GHVRSAGRELDHGVPCAGRAGVRAARRRDRDHDAVAHPPLPDRRGADGSVKVRGGLAIVLVHGEAAGATRRGRFAGVDPEYEIVAWWSVAAFAESVQRCIVDRRLGNDGSRTREEGEPERSVAPGGDVAEPLTRA